MGYSRSHSRGSDVGDLELRRFVDSFVSCAINESL